MIFLYESLYRLDRKNYIAILKNIFKIGNDKYSYIKKPKIAYGGRDEKK